MEEEFLYTARGKRVWIAKHAYEGMVAERPSIQIHEVLETVNDSDRVDEETRERRRAVKRIGDRTIIVIHVKGCSATRRILRT